MRDLFDPTWSLREVQESLRKKAPHTDGEKSAVSPSGIPSLELLRGRGLLQPPQSSLPPQALTVHLVVSMLVKILPL